MIIINIAGGLGNQLLQYAAAKHIALLRNTDLKIDITNFRERTTNHSHTYQLSFFNIPLDYANSEEINKLKFEEMYQSATINYIRKLLGKGKAYKENSANIYIEAVDTKFKPEVLELKDNTYIIGYFPSFKYFDAIRESLIKEFTPRNPLSEASEKVLKKIENSESVSIHFRRGDVLTDPNVIPWFSGICTDNYYKNSIDYIAQNTNNPHFYIFSNEIDWIKENFKIPFPVTYVDHNDVYKGYEDLWLMSKCQHNILAGGSSFSWWGAYLNQNPKKIVIHSHKMTNMPEYNHPNDYFLPDWHAVDS